MKRPYPDRKSFNKSITRIPSHKALHDYEYSLWEAGFEYAVRKMRQLNGKSKLIHQLLENEEQRKRVKSMNVPG